MIEISIPASGSEIFVGNANELAIYGPVPFPGKKLETVSYRHTFDHLLQKRGVYRENYVDNYQIKASMIGAPSAGHFTFSPTNDYPALVIYRGKTYQGGWVTQDLVRKTGNRVFQTILNSIGAPYNFDRYRAVIRENGSVDDVYIERWEYISKTSSSIYYSRKTKSRGWAWSNPYCSYPPSYLELVALCDRYLQYTGWGSSYNFNAGIIPGYDGTFLSEDDARDLVNAAWLNQREYPSDLTPKPWSELAHTASENFKIVRFNALEFISDLKNPTKLIPKLRNLRNIKGLAGTYLNVKYGILPTVDDLTSLYESVVKVRKNVDRNGFQTNSAGYLSSSEVGPYRHTLEQHLKIAIDNEDSRIQSIVTGLENVGLMPNASTLWELIPMSFAVDWFVNVGDYLGDIDANRRLARFNVRYCTTSTKRTWEVDIDPDEAQGFTGTIQACAYERGSNPHVPSSPPDLSAPLNVSNHWLEAAALTIQRIK